MGILSFQCRHWYSGGFSLELAFDLNERSSSLFGPSGSGKSSILNMIAGFLKPQQGTIRLGDRTLLDTARGVSLPPEERHVGIVYQDSLLFPHLSVEGNLRYGQRRVGHTRPTLDFDRVVKVLEIGPLLKRRPHNLSGGERQRVALGRALLSGPALLLMDEPLASLAATLKDRVLTYLERAVAEWGIPTLFVTHAQAEVRRAASWVVLLEKGRLVGAGTPDEALSRPEPLGWTNSTAPVNLLRLERAESHDGLCTGQIGGQMLQLPPRSPDSPTPSFVQFSPKDVVLARSEISDVSARNRFRGKVCRVIPVPYGLFVAVDIGQVLWAEITQQAAAELEVQPGTEVICLVKAHSLIGVE